MDFTEGAHLAVAKQWDFGLTKNDGRQVCVQFEILEGPDIGKRISWYGYFTEKAQERTLKALRNCGWKSDDIMDMEGMGDITVQLIIGYEEQQEGKNAGKLLPKIKWINQPTLGVRMERPLDMQAKRKFAAELRLHARQIPVVTGGTPAPGRAPTDPMEVGHGKPPEDTDTPF